MELFLLLMHKNIKRHFYVVAGRGTFKVLDILCCTFGICYSAYVIFVSIIIILIVLILTIVKALLEYFHLLPLYTFTLLQITDTNCAFYFVAVISQLQQLDLIVQFGILVF